MIYLRELSEDSSFFFYISFGRRAVQAVAGEIQNVEIYFIPGVII